MSNKALIEFLGKIRRIQSIMVQVATGRAEISEKESEYQRLYKDLYEDFKRQDLANPNQFTTLDEFYAYCRMRYRSYEDRRDFIKTLYESVLSLKEETSSKVQHVRNREVQKRHTLETFETRVVDRRKVFVVHGRNLRARDALFMFLRSIDLHPMEWPEIVAATGKGSPYIGEILDKAFSQAQAVIVLMTPDDEGRLRKHFRKAEDPKYESELTPQARLNVLFEAGMAIGRFPKRTILVQLGDLHPFSDIGGRHVIRLDDTPEKRRELALRLETAHCAVNLTGTDWLTAGTFGKSLSDSMPEEKDKELSVEISKAPVDLDSFDRSLKSLEEVTQPNTMVTLLSEFQPKLHSLCYDYKWTDDVKDRIVKVLKLIPKKLSNSPNISHYLQFLGMIINRHGKYTIGMIREKFLVELEEAFNDQEFETSAKILNILQRLNEYSEDYMTKLVDDAAYQWSDKRFEVLSGAIEFWGLKERDEEGHERVQRYLRQTMDDAERKKDKKTYSRVKKLYNQARR